MYKNIVKILLIGGVTLSMTGCFSQEISCGGDKELEIVAKASKDSVINALTMPLTLNMTKSGQKFIKDGKELPPLFAAMETATQLVEKSTLTWKNIRTISKDSSLNRAECKATIVYNVMNENPEGLLVDITYNVQTTDDGKNILAEVTEANLAE